MNQGSKFSKTLRHSIFLLLFLVKKFECWRFDVLGLDENEIELSKIAIMGTRAFVSIPRVYADQKVTLAELPWPERSLYMPSNTKAFPNLESQRVGDCTKLQSAVTLDVDHKGRLYVLDRGTEEECSAKIVIYDLRINKELMQRELTGVPVRNLSSLIVDVNPTTSDVRVILGDAGNNSLLVYNLNQHVWWKLTVSANFQVHGDATSLSDEPVQLSFNQLAISRLTSTLYTTSSQSPELYSINLEEFRNMEEPIAMYCNNYDNNGTEALVHYVGNKFGPSTALSVDYQGNLYYMYERDFVILKWNPLKPFIAENAEVVLQDESLIPHVVQIFAVPIFAVPIFTRPVNYNVWALNSRRNGLSSYTVKLRTFPKPLS